MKRLLLALGGLLASCGMPTGPIQPTLEFTAEILFGIPTLATRLEGQEGGVDVSGVFQTPTGDYTLDGMLESPGGRRLILQIRATKDRTGAPPFRVQNYYVGRIRNLPRGEYDLQVFETLNDSLPQSELAYHAKFRVD